MSVDRISAGIVPVLPPELERDIFLQAARSYRGVSIRLMLVSSRVKIWMEAFMYKTVVLRGAGHAFLFLYALANRSPEFAKTRVKALCIRPQIPYSLIIQLLTLCSGLESLALWISSTRHAASDSELTNLLSTLPLKFLSLDIMAVISPSHPKPDLQNHPAFIHLTHLDIVNHWVLWTSSLGIEHLPRLTHVAFRFWCRGNVNTALSLILKESPRLRVLILLADSVVLPGARRYLEKEGIRDERVVVMEHTRDADEWEAMERDSEGIWQRAESVVRWRMLTRGRCQLGRGVISSFIAAAGPFDIPPDLQLSP
ncbi:hypothetical protein BU15DRAFT_52498 [Melanogaster broomeanus]|nr:hypothetical protein BU15DRAFT_52498 [Melanogaster broomeanus]